MIFIRLPAFIKKVYEPSKEEISKEEPSKEEVEEKSSEKKVEEVNPFAESMEKLNTILKPESCPPEINNLLDVFKSFFVPKDQPQKDSTISPDSKDDPSPEAKDDNFDNFMSQILEDFEKEEATPEN